MRRCAGAMAALLCVARLASAQTDPKAQPDPNAQTDPRAVMPERPTVATHAYTVAPGYLEIETGGQWDRYDAGLHGFGVPTVLKFGLASHAQLSVFVPL